MIMLVAVITMIQKEVEKRSEKENLKHTTNYVRVLHDYILNEIYNMTLSNRRLLSLVVKAPVCCAGGLGFDSRPDHHSGS